MRKALLVWACIFAIIAIMASVRGAEARSNFYTANCQACHGATNTCDGCHAHGVHSSSAKSDLNLSATTDKTTYSPGEAMTVTVDGGYGRGGWVRVILYDDTGTEIIRSTGPSGLGGGAAFPITLNATVPSTPGTYTYTASWYGNQFDDSTIPAYFGPNWTPSANPGHGEEKVSTNSFDVVGAAAPDIAVSPPSINFGSITTGQSSTAQTVTISNNGNATLSVSGMALSGAGAAHFSLNTSGGTSPCGSASPTIPAGNNCTVTVTFSPSTTGAKSASLDVDSNDPDTPTASVTLSGTGVAPVPDIAVSTLSLSFGDVETGSSSSPQTVTISNTGTGDLSVTGMVVSGTNAADFSLDTGGGTTPCGSTAPTISAGGNCTVAITFSPTATGARSASLGITSDDPDENPVNISLSGNGTAPPVPDITVSSLSVGFGTIQEGNTSDQNVTVTNDGNATLNIGSVAAVDTLAAPFSKLSDNCSGQAIAAAGSCTITVRFAPSTANTYSDSFDIPSDDPDENPVTVNVSGTATSTPVPDISLSTLSVNFGGVKVGSSSSPQTVTVSNVGTADLSVTGMAVTGANAADFSLNPGDGTGGTCGSTTPITVTAGGNCTVTVTFSPSATGARSASLDIASDDIDEPSVSVALSGTGAVPDINVTDSVAPAGDLAVDFGDVTVDTTSAEQTITVANVGTADLVVSNMAVTGANASEFTLNTGGGTSPCGSAAPTVSAGGNCTVAITFSPTAMGTRSASLGIASDDPDENPVNVSLSGNGTPTPVPDIAVTDSVGTGDDLAVPFGDVTVGTSSPAATVTIANLGTAALGVTGIALSGTNASEFTLNTGGGTTPCGSVPRTVAVGGSCTLAVTFSPATTGAKGASLDITSNDPDEALVSVTLSGNGTAAPVPDITVTDSVAPNTDLAVDFGSVTVGPLSAVQSITVTNDGNASLTFTGIAQANPLAEPFGIQADSCSGVPLAPAASCTVLVRFIPPAAGPYNDSFEIASNDPDEATVTVTVSGTGTIAPVPDIAVTDSVAPVDDFALPFGDVTVGNSLPATVTIANQGSADLSVTGIALNGANASEFTLNVNGGTAPCGSTAPTISSGGNCTVAVTFSPSTTGAKGASLDIDSDDPDEASVSVSLGGNGLSAGANHPPSAPALAYPANGQVDVDVPVVFAWYRSSDPDGDAVTYNLFVCDNPAFTGCDVPENPSPIASAMKTGGLFAAGVGFMVLGMALGGSMGRKKKAALLIALLAAAVMLLAACSGGGGEKPVPPGDFAYSVPGLSSGTTYYWKVVADDGMGGSTDSAVWSFTTR